MGSGTRLVRLSRDRSQAIADLDRVWRINNAGTLPPVKPMGAQADYRTSVQA